VVLQEAVVPGEGSGVVGLRLVAGDASLGIDPGSQLLVGLARAAMPSAHRRRTSRLSWLALGVAGHGVETGSNDLAREPFLFGPPTGGTTGVQAVRIALQFLGVPYRWGGADPISGFDCSGLAMYVYAQLGISLTHYTGSQFEEGRPVVPWALQPGDLLFFHPSARGPQHEGIYIGGGRFVQAPHTGDVVKISSLAEPTYSAGFVGAIRPWGA
jgi:cell wall-associated NlpC family hydrolase